MKRERLFTAIFFIILAFAIGLVGFYVFSAEYGDGLEVTMERGEVEEAEQVHEAPLDYGEDYLATLIMGIVGFFVTFVVIFIIVPLFRNSNAS